MADPLERLTNLVALLLETRVPLTVHDICFALAGQYPEGSDARHAAFERDKATLRSVGVPLTQTVLSGEQAGQTGYRILREQYELTDLGLTDAERRALQLAVATVHAGPGWAGDAIMKLGGTVDDGPGPWAVMLTTSDRLPPLYSAVNERRTVEFIYRGQPRRLDPWGLLMRQGFWYVVGHDHGAGARRTYRVDRIEGDVRVDETGAATVVAPPGFDPAAEFEESIQAIGDAEGATEAQVAIDAERAAAAVRAMGDDAVTERRADGSVVLTVPCRNRLVFRAWVLGFVEHAEVLGPAEVRDEMVAWLEALARG